MNDTPAEQGERAARAENEARQEFEKAIQTPRIKEIAERIIRDTAALEDHNLAISDWEARGGRIAGVEFENLETGDKTWVLLRP
jgi:hypothetical protein